MTWVVWVALVLSALWLLGRTVAWLRGAPTPTDIRYHYRSRFAIAMARARRSPNNFAVTLGRHTFVRFGYIRAKHRRHEHWHSLQAHRLSVPVFLVVWAWQCATKGYRNAPLERDAVDFAEGPLIDYPDLP